MCQVNGGYCLRNQRVLLELSQVELRGVVIVASAHLKVSLVEPVSLVVLEDPFQLCYSHLGWLELLAIINGVNQQVPNIILDLKSKGLLDPALDSSLEGHHLVVLDGGDHPVERLEGDDLEMKTNELQLL